MGLWDSLGSDLGFDAGGDGGVINQTPMYADTAPDASGGNGSFLQSLLPTLTNGLNATINSALLDHLGHSGALYTVDAYGNVVPKAAAGANNLSYVNGTLGTSTPAQILQRPAVMLAIVAVAGLLIYAVAKR